MRHAATELPGWSRSACVLILGERKLFADAIRWVLESYGLTVRVVGSEREVLTVARRRAPDLILIDLELPELDGVTAGRSLRERLRSAKLVGVTARYEPDTLESALDAGFHGYLTKDTPLTRLPGVIGAVLSGDVVRSRRRGPAASSGPDDARARAPNGDPRLTAREVEVLRLLVGGASGGAIARELAIAPNTVRTHVRSLLAKLQVHSRLEAAAVAVRRGLIP